ncbi:MAG TPA: hypothetical protein VHQ64_07315 [Pyrinomonadaceae bacterium]|nr:hypothetical protein [Pyrinomonadaceae bacterium]
MNPSNLVSIGLRAKTARAIAVVLGGPAGAPVLLHKTEIKLIDPKVPATAQPYHAIMDLPWSQWPKAAGKSAQAIERVAAKALAKMIDELKANGNKVIGVGVVGAPDRDLARIGNPHIRAHAGEGILFRRVLEVGAEANRLKWRSFSDRDFDQAAAALVDGDYSKIKRCLDDLRRSVSAPWRADEKHAAMAAWLVLHA